MKQEIKANEALNTNPEDVLQKDEQSPRLARILISTVLICTCIGVRSVVAFFWIG